MLYLADCGRIHTSGCYNDNTVFTGYLDEASWTFISPLLVMILFTRVHHNLNLPAAWQNICITVAEPSMLACVSYCCSCNLPVLLYAGVLLSKADLQELKATQTGCIEQALPNLVGWDHSMQAVNSDVHGALVKQASPSTYPMLCQ